MQKFDITMPVLCLCAAYLVPNIEGIQHGFGWSHSMVTMWSQNRPLFEGAFLECVLRTSGEQRCRYKTYSPGQLFFEHIFN
jgi:hypothetical protein